MKSSDVQIIVTKLYGITKELKAIRDFSKNKKNIDPVILEQVGLNLADMVKGAIQQIDRNVILARECCTKSVKIIKSKDVIVISDFDDALTRLNNIITQLDEMQTTLTKKSQSDLKYALEDSSAQVYYALETFERYDYKMIKMKQKQH
jgi:hypothetical protein